MPAVAPAEPDGEVGSVVDGDDDRLARMFAALASTVRLSMLRQLSEESHVSACGFAAQGLVAQSTVSHHLLVLREAGLVRAERCGISIRYSIDPGALDVLTRTISELRPRGNGTGDGGMPDVGLGDVAIDVGDARLGPPARIRPRTRSERVADAWVGRSCHRSG